MTLLGIAALIAALGYGFKAAAQAIATAEQSVRDDELHELRIEREIFYFDRYKASSQPDLPAQL